MERPVLKRVPSRVTVRIPAELRRHLRGVDLKELFRVTLEETAEQSPTWRHRRVRRYEKIARRAERERDRVGREEHRQQTALECLEWTFDLQGGYVGCSGLDGVEAGYVDPQGKFVSSSRYCERDVAYGLRDFLLSDRAECVSFRRVEPRWVALADRWGFGSVLSSYVRAAAGSSSGPETS